MSRLLLPAILLVLPACFASQTRQLEGAAGPQTAAAGEPHGSDESPPAEPPLTEEARHAEAVEAADPPHDEHSHELAEDHLAPPTDAPTVRAPHPFAELDRAALEALLLEDPSGLGSLSLGRTNAGALFNAVPMPEGDRWKIVNPSETWGTQETIDYLVHCIDRVNEQFPDTPALYIGDISARGGGHLAPHLSHQSGRDVDLGYYYTTPQRWYARGHAENLDLARNWAFVKAMVTETDVEAIFIDHSIQKLLREYAESIGEEPTWLDQVFGGPSLEGRRPLITHEDGHATHIHVRFYNPIAQESGRRLYELLVAHGKISPPTYYVKHRARPGDTLNRLARKYDTTVTAIKKANGLRDSRIFANRHYRIPRRGGVRPMSGPLNIPARLLPPPARTSARE